MNRRNLKLLKEVFTLHFLQRFPGYAIDGEALLPPGGLCFRRPSTNGRTFFVILAAWARDEKFTVECATSIVGQLPLSTQMLSHTKILEAMKTGARFRLGRLIAGKDMWWRLAPEPKDLLDLTDAEAETGNWLHERPVIATRDDVADIVADVVKQIEVHWAPLSDA